MQVSVLIGELIKGGSHSCRRPLCAPPPFHPPPLASRPPTMARPSHPPGRVAPLSPSPAALPPSPPTHHHHGAFPLPQVELRRSVLPEGHPMRMDSQLMAAAGLTAATKLQVWKRESVHIYIFCRHV